MSIEQAVFMSIIAVGYLFWATTVALDKKDGDMVLGITFLSTIILLLEIMALINMMEMGIQSQTVFAIMKYQVLMLLALSGFSLSMYFLEIWRNPRNPWGIHVGA